MVLSHSQKFIFICNGKTGTTSIESALSSYHEGGRYEKSVPGLYTKKHIPPGVVRALLGPKIWDEYFTFCFVRNPWDWFVSQHFWNWQPPQISKKRLLRRPISTLRTYWEESKKREKRRQVDTFSVEHIRETYNLLRQYRAVYQADSLFQYHYAYSPGGNKLVDFVGRFEQISEDFQTIGDRIGIDETLPHRNTTTHRTYHSYYTQETAEFVRDLYEIDVETFGYEFGAEE